MVKANVVSRKWGLDLTDDAWGSRPGMEGFSNQSVQDWFNPPGWGSGKQLDGLTRAIISSGGGDGSAAEESKEGKSKQPKLSREQQDQQKYEAVKKCWIVAFGPAKNLLVVGFMMFFTGAGTNIFSIMTVISVLFMQLKAMTQVNAVFEPQVKATPDIKDYLLPLKAVYLLLTLSGVAMALYKGYMVGIIPITEADWAGLLPMRYQPERVAASVRLN